MLEAVGTLGIILFVVFALMTAVAIVKMYHKVDQGRALVRNGMGDSKVSFSGMMVAPVIHRKEFMDISIKRIEIERLGADGLICKDDIRADIKVAFFIRVNKTVEDVLKVAQSIGCNRASDVVALVELFDAKFSEALKTVGKRFDFIDLYNSREHFKQEILQIIGTDLNGFVMDDAAIDYLEQTPLTYLKADNILDAHGIKKITEITASQAVLSNEIQREKEKTITKQDVEAREAILELNRQLAEAEEKQKREIATVTARENAETEKIAQEERLKAENARITTEEEIQIAEENKQRQVIVAQKNKERVDVVETERVDKDRLLELNEKERIVELAIIEKERAVEEERKNIQEVIRERVVVEKAVVEEEEKIKDTRAIALADREKVVAVVKAQQTADENKVQEVTAAQAAREAANLIAEQKIVEAEADQQAAIKKAEAMKTIAEARAAEEATLGLSEVRVMEAKADAIEKQGVAEAAVIEQKAAAEAKGIEAMAGAMEKEGAAEASVIEAKAVAEAKGVEAKAVALEKEGAAEASVMSQKYHADAQGIEEKAEAMKKLDGVGREHEEFKLELEMKKQVELAKITIQKDIADAQAAVIQAGLKAAKIDIVGGESMFFDRIVGSITQGKSIDRMVGSSGVLSDIKNTFFNGDAEQFSTKLRELVNRFGMSSEDLKNITISALITRLLAVADDDTSKGFLTQMGEFVVSAGLGNKPASIING